MNFQDLSTPYAFECEYYFSADGDVIAVRKPYADLQNERIAHAIAETRRIEAINSAPNPLPKAKARHYDNNVYSYLAALEEALGGLPRLGKLTAWVNVAGFGHSASSYTKTYTCSDIKAIVRKYQDRKGG